MVPCTWKKCFLDIMQQFLDDSAPNDVIPAWQSLTFEKGETIQKYVDRFWSLHLKSIVLRELILQSMNNNFV